MALWAQSRLCLTRHARDAILTDTMAATAVVRGSMVVPEVCWPPAPGERALVRTVDAPGDGLLKTEFWSAAARRPATPRQWAHRQLPASRSTAARTLGAALVSEDLPLSLTAALEARAETHLAFELRRALEGTPQGGMSSKLHDTVPTLETPKCQPEFEEKRYSHCSPEEFYLGRLMQRPIEVEAPRPPQGSGYSYPSYDGNQRPLLTERFTVPSSERGASGAGETSRCENAQGPYDSASRLSRTQRIEALERGLLAHDEERLRTIAAGTTPLRGPGGEPLLPVPPLDPHQCRLALPQRLRVLSHNRASKQAMKDLLMAAEVVGREARDRPWAATDPMARAAGLDEAVAGTAAPTPRPGLPAAPSSPSTRGARPPRDLGALGLRDAEALLREAEGLLLGAAGDDQWSRIASQLCVKSYEVEPIDVLRMVRVIGAAAARCKDKTRGKKELLQAADHLVQSLTARLQDADLEFVVEVVETMGDVGVGTQAYLDMIMAFVLACHHRDCQALSPAVALRLATALGRLAVCSLRLRPRGVGGPSASTNARVMEVLQRRIAERLKDCGEEDLARLDSHYIARLCGDAERHAIVSRFSELDIGFRERTKQYLPLAVRLQETIQRELPDSFRWSLPRKAREYLERLRVQGIRVTAPWSLGETSTESPAHQALGEDIFSPARLKLQSLRAIAGSGGHDGVQLCSSS